MPSASASASSSNGASGRPAPTKPQTQSGMLSFYLIAFNAISMLAWSATLVTLIVHFARGGDLQHAYDHSSTILSIAQSLALLELVHSLLGLVRSPFLTALMQVSSRILLVWGILHQVPVARRHSAYTLMVVSWCLAEIPRYGFYTLTLLKQLNGDESQLPYAMRWLRYSLFLVLYPTGITGEILEIYHSLAYVQRHSVLSLQMPNPWNFAFDYHYALIFALLTYVPGSYIMYTHMLKARSKNLSTAHKSKSL